MREIVIDNFAGGGGASTGIALAIGRSVDVAINHDPVAIALHRANHPDAFHFCENVWDVDPREAAADRPVGLVWLSPDCKHFSKAKGGKPVSKDIRGLAWVAVRWAATVKPRVIMLENVEEFITWGPLIPQTDKETGRMLKKITYTGEDDRVIYDTAIAAPGEEVPPELRIMVPDPKQKGREFRVFVNALRRQGYHVEWRELRACDYGAPTIRKRLFLVARRDGQPIRWPKPTHGDPESAAVKAGKLKPWRTAAEIIDWSLPCPSIFERKRPLAENTMRRIARGIYRFVLDNPRPFIIPIAHYNGSNPAHSIDEPLRTITANPKGGHFALINPTLIQTGYGEKAGQAPRVPGLHKPLGTVVAGGQKHALVAAFLSKYHGERRPDDTGTRGQLPDEPIRTLDTSNRFSLVTSHLIKLRGTCKDGQPVTEPMPTITAGGLHVGEVRAFLTKFYGNETGQKCDNPLHTITTKARFGLVTVHGEDYQIVDIGMRMLEPHELFAAQGFPGDYIIDRGDRGQKLSKAAQVALCGNSVPPALAEALVRSNLPELCGMEVNGRAVMEK